MFVSILFGIIAIFGLSYAFIRKKYSYWVERGVYSPTPAFPLGNFNGLGSTRHSSEITSSIYMDVKGKAPFAGIYLFTHPCIVVADLELAKSILIKDFDCFRNRPFYYNEKDDPLSAHLLAIEDNKWRDMRSKLTPTFTSGKMKIMFDTVIETANELVTYLNTLADMGKSFDSRDMVSRYSTDVIGSCAFGINCNSIKNPNADFRAYGLMAIDPSRWQQIQIFFGKAFPDLARKIGICFLPQSVSSFFKNAVSDTITFRRENNIKRKDFMQLLLDLQNDKEIAGQKLTDLDIAAQAFLFFIAGFETSGSTMSYAIYELAQHPEIQNRLRNEITSVIRKHDNKLTYEAIHEMPYLDMVMNETLRKYPAVDSLIRRAERDYLVPGTKHLIEKDTNVFIPLYGLHHDPELYPEPDKFDPERFSQENVANRHPFAFLPFGEGPRACIGLRFGIMQTRLGLISLLRNFRLLTCDDTPKRITFLKRYVFLAPERKIMLKIQRI